MLTGRDREDHAEVTGPARSRRNTRSQYGILTSIAGEAGVSLATVSKVVHRRRDVSEATRARIEALLAERGYVRVWENDALRPRQILAVFRDLAGPYTLEVVRGIVESAAELGVHTTVGTTNRRPIAQWLQESVALGAAGVVIVISMLAEQDQRHILEQRLPVVLVDPLNAPSADIPSVGVTNWHGATTAVQHLIDLGHRRIGMLAGRSSSLAGSARLHGYRAALAEAGIPYEPAYVRSTDFDYGEALRAARGVLGLRDRPTALFCASDAQALGALEAARQLRIAVPRELSVMSFDDTLVASMASPPLSAVRQPFRELGQEATRVLLHLADGRPPATLRRELATQLVVRGSTAPPGAGNHGPA
ncbi:substrate-binding domain-containing protein [Streptomyces sp. Li-HN-5-11]|uniref:LacI family DNA-binding transcriptional regulator n=1 Tax=Streptomyces sp. Li-HN-5-11 TaxID=3075432 RepID=UPI0028A8BF1B|nr:substrate-binding domain-containing protein [Streptomyces sp. Li-HN-5-11]WNM32884.1 substrate-binding domain-containing protein [Streptomyces sp. Li-HN-5-11]